MKITKISITIEPNSTEAANGMTTRVLERGSDKRWVSVNDPDGFFPFEIKLATKLQEVIIEDFNK